MLDQKKMTVQLLQIHSVLNSLLKFRPLAGTSLAAPGLSAAGCVNIETTVGS